MLTFMFVLSTAVFAAENTDAEAECETQVDSGRHITANQGNGTNRPAANTGNGTDDTIR